MDSFSGGEEGKDPSVCGLLAIGDTIMTSAVLTAMRLASSL